MTIKAQILQEDLSFHPFTFPPMQLSQQKHKRRYFGSQFCPISLQRNWASWDKRPSKKRGVVFLGGHTVTSACGETQSTENLSLGQRGGEQTKAIGEEQKEKGRENISHQNLPPPPKKKVSAAREERRYHCAGGLIAKRLHQWLMSITKTPPATNKFTCFGRQDGW